MSIVELKVMKAASIENVLGGSPVVSASRRYPCCPTIATAWRATITPLNDEAIDVQAIFKKRHLSNHFKQWLLYRTRRAVRDANARKRGAMVHGRSVEAARKTEFLARTQDEYLSLSTAFSH